MHGITRKLIHELIQTWREKRGKELSIPEMLVNYIAERAHQKNEQSKGKEGGRLVRKLIADWVESPLQKEMSNNPEQYRRCREIHLAAVIPESTPASAAVAPEVAVRFV